MIDKLRKNIGYVIIFGITLGIMVNFLIIDMQPVQPTTIEQDNLTAPLHQRDVVCPNPNCPLHDINYRVNNQTRPIDMEYDPGLAVRSYLCGVCGRQWNINAINGD